MSSILRDLYFGRLIPFERRYTRTPADNALLQKISVLKEYFKGELSPEDYEKVEEMESLQAESFALEDASLFEYGFCMGILMMMDVLNFKETQLDGRERSS